MICKKSFKSEQILMNLLNQAAAVKIAAGSGFQQGNGSLFLKRHMAGLRSILKTASNRYPRQRAVS